MVIQLSKFSKAIYRIIVHAHQGEPIRDAVCR